MSGSSSGQASEARGPGSRAREDAELLAPPEVDPVQLSRNMFAQPPPRPPPAPLTNLHLNKAARLDKPGATASAGVRDRTARSVAASSVRGGRAAFSVVSDEEVIDVDGEPTTLADDDLDLPPPSPYDEEDEQGRGRFRGGAAGGGLGASGIEGLGNGAPDPLEELEADTPAVRLAEANADLDAEMQGGRDPWAMVQMAQMVLAQAKVVWRTMPVVVREEPLLLAKAHFSLARAYQALGGCDRQASDHGKQALAAIPRDVADTEGARALKTEVQVMRAEALLSSAALPGLPSDAACNQARKALTLLVKAGGLTEPVAWTQEEVDENDLPGHIQRATIDKVTDMGILALMAQSHGVIAEARLKTAEGEEGERRSSLRSAAEAASRLDRKTERGDAFYSAEQMEKYKSQEQHFRDEADNHMAEALRLAAEAERAYDAAMYCLNYVIDREGNRLEGELGREAKLAHPTFQALWRRSLDFMAGIATAYALQRKDTQRLAILDEILTAFVQYGPGGWLPTARHIQALKDKGTLLVDKRDYEGAMSCYETLTDVVSDLFADDVVRKELQVAEALKLRGDVALAAGDFRTAQHMFNQALELYQRHLGAQAPVALDLLHRIDEVKSYLADARVMGRLASFPGRASQTVAASVLAHSVSGSGAGSAATTPKSVSMSSRGGAPPRPPPPLSTGPGSTRPSSGLATPIGDTGRTSVSGGLGGGGSGRVSIDGMYGAGGGGDGGSLHSPALSAASGLQRPPSSSGLLPALPGGSGSRRPSLGYSGVGSASGRVSATGGSVRDGADGGGMGDGEGSLRPQASVASHRSGEYGLGIDRSWAAAGSVQGSMSRRSGAGDGGEGAPGSPSILSHRSGGGVGDVSGGGGGWLGGGAAASHHSGELGGSPSATSLSRRSNASGGFGAGGFGGGGDGYGGGAASHHSGELGGSPSVTSLSHRSHAGGAAGGDNAGGWPGAPASHHSGELGGSPSATSLSRRSNASGFGAAGFGTGGGGAGDVNGFGWPGAPASHHSGELGGSMSRRSNASGGFGAGGFGTGGGGAEDAGAAGGWPGSASPQAAPASHHSGELGGSPSVASLSRRSNASGIGGAGYGTGGGGGEEAGTGGWPGAPASHHSGELGGSPSVASLSRRSHTSAVGGAGAGEGEAGGSGSRPGSASSQRPGGSADLAAVNNGSGFGSRRPSGGLDGGASGGIGGGWGGSSASRRQSGDLYGAAAAGGVAAASPAASVAASRRLSNDMFGGEAARPGSPGGASTTSASRGFGAGGGGGLYGGDEPRPGTPGGASTTSASRGLGGTSGRNLFGGEEPRPGTPGGASTTSASRGYGGAGGANLYGSEEPRPGTPGGASTASASRGFGGDPPPRPASPGAASTASASRNFGTAASGGLYGGEEARPGTPGGASTTSASRGYGGAGGTSGTNLWGASGGDAAARPGSPGGASTASASRGAGGTNLWGASDTAARPGSPGGASTASASRGAGGAGTSNTFGRGTSGDLANDGVARRKSRDDWLQQY